MGKKIKVQILSAVRTYETELTQWPEDGYEKQQERQKAFIERAMCDEFGADTEVVFIGTNFLSAIQGLRIAEIVPYKIADSKAQLVRPDILDSSTRFHYQKRIEVYDQKSKPENDPDVKHAIFVFA